VEAKKMADDGTTDHDKVVGKFGVMYFGVTAQPIATSQAGSALTQFGQGTVQTPVIGMRYWMKERLGIDAGVGFNAFSSSATVQQNNTEVSTDGPAVVAFALHAGVPVAFAYGKHYTFLAVPEVNFGYATQTEAQQNVQPGQQARPDVHRSGVRFDVGARIGTEIQFGFIGLPELALQASIGLDLRYQSYHTSQDAGAGVTTKTSASLGQWNFGTTVQSDPWALFVNNISAIYYFP
jgi:hypothetical protein